jgi:hypothetical protein
MPIIILPPYNQNSFSGNWDPNATAAWDPTRKTPNGSITGGGLTFTSPEAVWDTAIANKFKSSGKWYWEMTAGTNILVGIATNLAKPPSVSGKSSSLYNTPQTASFNSYNPTPNNSIPNASACPTITSFTPSQWTGTTVIGFALDMDNKALYVSNSGVWLNKGNPLSGDLHTGAVFWNLSGNIGPAISAYSGTSTANFGSKAFTYAIPTGYKAFNAN